MYVKEDLIIPQHTAFYDLISQKARGKSGPLFHFDVHEDIRMQNDATVEKNESHAGAFELMKIYVLYFRGLHLGLAFRVWFKLNVDSSKRCCTCKVPYVAPQASCSALLQASQSGNQDVTLRTDGLCGFSLRCGAAPGREKCQTNRLCHSWLIEHHVMGRFLYRLPSRGLCLI
jgi:hypothetical protein